MNSALASKWDNRIGGVVIKNHNIYTVFHDRFLLSFLDPQNFSVPQTSLMNCAMNAKVIIFIPEHRLFTESATRTYTIWTTFILQFSPANATFVFHYSHTPKCSAIILVASFVNSMSSAPPKRRTSMEKMLR